MIPDTGKVEDYSPEDLRVMLKKTADRLQRERQKSREEAAQGDRPRAKDW